MPINTRLLSEARKHCWYIIQAVGLRHAWWVALKGSSNALVRHYEVLAETGGAVCAQALVAWCRRPNKRSVGADRQCKSNVPISHAPAKGVNGWP